jgi:ATPase subunit of ABC transporter with duplicated ATPase domains
MASYQYVYVMKQLGKVYPGGKQVLKDIWLSFLPGVKIGVIGLNGSGKSTLLKIMAGMEKEFTGEAWAADGARVGFLSQEPQLDTSKDVMGNVMIAVAKKKALIDRYNEIAANYTDETADEMAKLQDGRRGCVEAFGRREAARGAVPVVAGGARSFVVGRADEPLGRGIGCVA